MIRSASSTLARRAVTSLRLAAPASSHTAPSSTSAASSAPSSPPQPMRRRREEHTRATRREFSSSLVVGNNNDVGGELLAIIQRELDEENETGVPPEIAEIKSELDEDWTVLDGISGIGDGGGFGGGASVRMLKKTAASNGAKIGIVFHCQDSEDVGPELEDIESGSAGVDEEEENTNAIRFGVTVSKAGKTAVFHCVSQNAEATVEAVSARDGDAEVILAQLASGQGAEAALYQGPDFDELSEDLRESFTDYVRNDCGVTAEVAAFISMYADHREQEEYLAWLDAMKGIVS